MKILHINFLLEAAKGGVPSAVANIIRSTLNADIQHSVVGGVGVEAVGYRSFDELYSGAQSVVAFNRRFSPTDVWKYYKWLQLNAHDYDIIHIHGLFNYFTVLASKFCIDNRVPYVVSPHGMLSPYGMLYGSLKKKIWLRLFDKDVLNKAVFVHACSDIERAAILERHPTVNLKVIPLPVSRRKVAVNLSNNVVREVSNRFQCPRRFLFVGRLDPIKNLGFLLRCFSKVNPECYSLSIAGDGSEGYRRRLASLANELGISKNVKFLGHVNDVQNLYNRHDVLVLPSLSESFGLVAVEAAIAGLRVLVSDRVGVGLTLKTLGAAKIFDLDADSLVTILQDEIESTEINGNDVIIQNAVHDFFSISGVGNILSRSYFSI